MYAVDICRWTNYKLSSTLEIVVISESLSCRLSKFQVWVLDAYNEAYLLKPTVGNLSDLMLIWNLFVMASPRLGSLRCEKSCKTTIHFLNLEVKHYLLFSISDKWQNKAIRPQNNKFRKQVCWCDWWCLHICITWCNLRF